MMNDFFDNDELEQEEYEQEVLADKFQNLIANNEPVFFSSEDFLDIIDYFVQEDDFYNIIASTDIALKFYPDNIEIVLRKCQFAIDSPNENYLETVEEVMYYAEPFGNDAAYIYRCLATDLFETEDFEESLYFCRLTLIKDTDDEEIWSFFVMSASHFPTKEKENTLFIEEMVKTNPYSAHIWFALTLLSLLYGRYENSLKYAEYTLDLDKTNIEAQRYKAESLLNIGKMDEGMVLLEEIFKQEPENPQILHALGGGYQQKGDFEKAIYFYKKAFDSDKENFSALMNIGICYFSLNDFNTAQHYVKRAIDADPNDMYFQLSYANMLYSVGYKEDGENLYREIYANFYAKDICAISWAMTIAADGRLKDAINILNSTIDSTEIKEPNIYYSLIDLAASNKGYTEMIEHYLNLLSVKFNVKEEDLTKSCPHLMHNKEYRNLITQYIQ